MTNLTSSTRVRLHPVNPAEAVIMPFFDVSLSPLEEWTLEAGAGTRGLRVGSTYTTVIYWDAAVPGESAFTWRWSGRLDVSHYDGLFLQASLPSTATVRFSALVDGAWQTIAEARGCNVHEDYTGDFTGRVLESLEITVIPDTPDAGGFGTYYIGVHHSGRLHDWLAYEDPDVYPADWPEFIKPEAEWALQPEVGLYFDAEDVDDLRRKLATPPYRELTTLLREEARGYLSLEPERQIRHYLAVAPSPFAYSARSRDRGRPLWRPLELCAFFGLLDGDPALVRMAARCALAIAHTRHWAEGMVEHDFPGSAMNWRSFYQNVAVDAMAKALDWIGGALTGHGREVLCHSIYFKGLAPIKHDFARYEYIYHMNQAVFFSMGRLAGLLALNRYWPRLGWEIVQAEQDFLETVNRIIAPDGGYGEGPGYYSGMQQYLLSAALMLARHKGVEPASLLPDGIVTHSAGYFGPFVSSADGPRRLRLSDGVGTYLHPDWLAMMARVTGDPRWQGLLTRSLAGLTPDMLLDPSIYIWMSLGTRTLVFGPESPDEQKIVPTFVIHPGTGHATSRRATPHGDVRLHLCGSSATEGHSHQDKGGILLEAFGETLLLDRGTPAYSDPSTSILKEARLHNLAVPADANGYDGQQLNPCPGAVCPVGEGDDTRLSLTIDTTPAWGDLAQRAMRHVESPDPLHITLIDEFDLPAERPVTVHFQSYAPVEITGNTAVFTHNRSRLTITWDWPGKVVHAAPDLHDGDHRAVTHLAIQSSPATTHRLVTNLVITPIT